jgi:hypothetical protein
MTCGTSQQHGTLRSDPRPIVRSSKLYIRNLLRSDIHEEGSVKKLSSRLVSETGQKSTGLQFALTKIVSVCGV